jgi:hypothetical protein
MAAALPALVGLPVAEHACGTLTGHSRSATLCSAQLQLGYFAEFGKRCGLSASV